MNLCTESNNEILSMSLTDIIEYFGKLRHLILDGEFIYNSGLVHAIGIERHPTKNRIIGLVRRPYPGNAYLDEVILENLTFPQVCWRCLCSCDNPPNGKCKHIAACLLHIYKKPVVHYMRCIKIRKKKVKAQKSVSPEKIKEFVRKKCANASKEMSKFTGGNDGARKLERMTKFLEELVTLLSEYNV